MATLIDMPKLSDTMTVGTLVRWLKNEGDPVTNGDMIAEVGGAGQSKEVGDARLRSVESHWNRRRRRNLTITENIFATFVVASLSAGPQRPVHGSA